MNASDWNNVQLLKILTLVIAYLLGSLPSGVWVTRLLTGKDIRHYGDGNSGARNVTHMIGWKAGFLVGIADFGKGWLAIWFAQRMGFPDGWLFLAGALAVIGHDYPVFAEFTGGQGMATSLGTMLKLFTLETLIGLLIFGLVYCLTRHFNISAGIGLGMIAAVLIWNSRPALFLIYTVCMFLSIPLKKHIDSQTRITQPNSIWDS